MQFNTNLYNMSGCGVCKLKSTIEKENLFLENNGVNLYDSIDVIITKLNKRILDLLELIEGYDLCVELYEADDSAYAMELGYKSINCDREIKLINGYLDNIIKN